MIYEQSMTRKDNREQRIGIKKKEIVNILENWKKILLDT
jgi:hypothetical protein